MYVEDLLKLKDQYQESGDIPIYYFSDEVSLRVSRRFYNIASKRPLTDEDNNKLAGKKYIFVYRNPFVYALENKEYRIKSIYSEFCSEGIRCKSMIDFSGNEQINIKDDLNNVFNRLFRCSYSLLKSDIKTSYYYYDNNKIEQKNEVAEDKSIVIRYLHLSKEKAILYSRRDDIINAGKIKNNPNNHETKIHIESYIRHTEKGEIPISGFDRKYYISSGTKITIVKE
jgi:hypothetical protein